MFGILKKLFKRKPTAKSMRDSKEPWVNVIAANIDPNNPKQGNFELEWNAAFVISLRNHGYLAPSPEEIVDLWFTELCRNISQDGIAAGDFIAEAGRIATNGKTRSQS